MQNTDNKGKNEKNTEKKISFKRITERLKDSDERQVRSRLKSTVEFLLNALISYMLMGAALFFGTHPIAIALACTRRKHLLAVATGAFFAAILGSVPIVYLLLFPATLMIRILVTYLPPVFKELSDKEESLALVPIQHEEVIEGQYRNDLSSEYSVQTKVKKEKKTESDVKCSLMSIFNESLSARLISVTIGGLLCGIFLLIEADFSFFSLWATLTLCLCCPLSLLLLEGYFGNSVQKREWLNILSILFICAACMLSATSKSVIGMPMPPFLAMLLTLYMTSARGILFGGAVGVICGALFDPIYIILLVICAVIFSLLFSVKQSVGLAVIAGCVVVFCYYIGKTDGLTGVLPPMLLAIPIYMLADKYREMMFSPYGRTAALAGGLYFAQAVTEKSKNAAVKERLGALSEAFSSLSETFYKLSDRLRRPDTLGLKKICEAAFEKSCDGCKNRELCWGSEQSDTLEAIKRVTSALHIRGYAETPDMPDAFRERCFRRNTILTEVNQSVARVTENIIKGDQIGFFASNYDDINAILKDALESDGSEYESDKKAGDAVFDLLYGDGFKVKGVAVYGKRRRHVVIKGISQEDRISAKSADALRISIGRIVGAELSSPVFEVGADGGSMLLCSKPQFKAYCAHGYLSAKKTENAGDKSLYVDPFSDEDEILCGDTTNAFITDSSYFYSLISDGMGSGSEASFISGVCSVFIEKMLCAGNRADITVRMLNNVIRSENMGSGGECSATVDLCELDLISGTASFIKSGAAPTYIARGGTVYKVYSRTMPIGILKDTDTRISKFDTQSGDMIVMLSDGCCPDSEDCPWLVEFLCKYMEKKDKNANGTDAECESIKDTLISLAAKNFPNGKERDDISVSVIMIE